MLGKTNKNAYVHGYFFIPFLHKKYLPCSMQVHSTSFNPCSIYTWKYRLFNVDVHSTSLKRSQLPGPRSWGTLEKEEKGFFCGRDKGVFRSTYVEEQPKVVKKDLGDVKSCHARRRGYQVCQERHWKNSRRYVQTFTWIFFLN